MTSERPVRPLLVWALLLWITAIIAAYYAVHKPLPANIGQAGALWALLANGVRTPALADAALNLATAFWLTAIAGGVGSLALERLLPHDAFGSHSGRVSFALGAGFGILALLFFGLGLGGGLRPNVAAVVVIGCTGVAAFGYARWPCGMGTRNEERGTTADEGTGEKGQATREHERWGFVSYATIVLVALLLVVALTRSLTPPVAWDALVYHLTAPARYIQTGRIVPGIDAPHFYFPPLVEQLYTAALLLRGDIAAQLMHWPFTLAGVLALFAFLRERAGGRAAWFGIALLAAIPTLWSLASKPYVEWALLAYFFLSFWALQNALDRHNSRWLVLSGALAGLALGVKYTAAFPVLGLGLVLLWSWLRRRGTTLSDVAAWALTAGLVASPWYLKNWAFTGNPIYPFLFGGWQWDAWRTEWFSRPGTGLVTEPWRLLTAPFELTAFASEGSQLYDVTLSPLLLGFLPLLLLLRGRSAWAGTAAFVVAVSYAGWLWGAAQSELLLQGRLLLPILPLLGALLAAGLAQSHRLALPALHTPFLLEVTTVLVLAVSSLSSIAAWAADPPLPYIAGAESRASYLERHLGAHYRAVENVNTTLPADARVLFLWEPRTLLCRVDCQPDALLYNWRDLLRKANDEPAAAYRSLVEQGYTHVLLNGAGMRFFSTPPNVELEPLHIVAFATFEGRYLERIAGPTLEEILGASRTDAPSLEYTLFRIKPGVSP